MKDKFILFTVAHLKEAKYLLESFSWKRKVYLHINYFETEKYIILVTGEGHLQALQNTTIFLSTFHEKIEMLINFGVCGIIRENSNIKIHDIVQIRNHYLSDSNNHEFKSFRSLRVQPLKIPFVDCVSATKRIVERESKKKLAPIAHIVDRESYSTIKSASPFHIPHFCFKIISDESDGKILCSMIKEKSYELSKMIGIFLLENLSQINVNNNSLQDIVWPEEIYLTFTQKKIMQKIFQTIIRQKKSTTMTIDIITKYYNNIVIEYPQLKKKDLSKVFLKKLSEKYENIKYLD